MEANSNDRKILAEIRTRLMRFCNCRERAYEMMRKKGHAVPDYSAKIAAILFIRVHLQASQEWNLIGHIRLVSETLRKHITTILPFEFHEQDRQRSYRKHMLDLIQFCDEQMDKKQIRLLTNKPQAA